MMTAWSYSRWEVYDTCPAKARFKFLDKVPEPDSPALVAGTEAHDEIAAYLRNDREGPVRGWEYFAELLSELRTLAPLIEQEWGYTSEWKPTGWFAKDTWFRSKLDAAVVYSDNTADVVDHKTGKSSPKHAQQAELYAISVFLRYLHVTHVTVRFWYLDSGEESVYRFARSGMSEILTRWTQRAERMLGDRVLAPRPGAHCQWCPFAKSKGSVCKYG